MLKRVLPIPMCAVALLTACKEQGDSSLVGSWYGHDASEVIEISFASDHTFTEWDATHPPFAGEWHVSGSKVVFNFHGGARPQDKRTIALSLVMPDLNHLTLRRADGGDIILERLK